MNKVIITITDDKIKATFEPNFNADIYYHLLAVLALETLQKTARGGEVEIDEEEE